MKVEIWSDIMCPFCYIGKRRFEAGLEQFAHKEEVEIVYRSFELSPDSPKDSANNVHEMLASKYGMSVEQAKAMNADVGKQAEAVGLDFQFDTMVLTNTFDAHRLIQFASQQGKGKEVAEMLFKAYFTDSSHVGDHETLIEIAEQAGLSREETAAMLAGNQYSEEVRADEEEARQLGVNGVPFYVINRKYGVSGAQPSEAFLQVLQKVWDEEKPLQIIQGDAGQACSDGVCSTGNLNPDSK
ncbi:DsbA family oxidoreductase [Paenibacillus sp. UNC451MF]|uniref:DsbA family oxidoreductase n=1 Tax=Paenibacillus sp. UNC451MF TaxID=1449063 RepID=UPI00048DD2C9|nr:DsbA family oxidoreductase [Paenibacillus sp. UNC451MF]